MLFILGLAFLGSAFATPIQVPDAKVTARNTAYVLPGESYPTFYDVRLFINPDFTDYFFGNVSIRILPAYTTSQIVMHAMEMQIDSISVYSDVDTVTNLFSSYTIADDDTHFLRINMNRNLTALQPHTVYINYVAQYASNMFGVYVSTYPDSNGNTINLVTSQLQPTFARRAFPCYDEPAQKAVFRTTIYAPPAFAVVRSNMPLRNDTLQAEVTGWTKHEFDDTLVMSSYLIAYLVSNFDYIENDQNPTYRIPFRVYSRPGTQNTAEFALDFGQRNMMALEEYTNFPYLFPKMDKVAVPDFAAGAMENWGLVIYREVALLVQDGVTTTSVRQNIGRIICHENVHQWFGNEVGPLSWTYTWLNEGFANFFENFATDLVLPEWRMMDQFVIALQNVFQSDAVETVNPMTFEVYTPSEILGTFNSVAYQKYCITVFTAGSVIRMMQHFLTPEVFRQGLSLYIQTMSRRAAAPANLYTALQTALDQSNHTIPYALATVMQRWTTQGGFPVLNVRRMAALAQSVSVSQERFLTDRTLTSTHRWHVPVNWVLSTNVDFSDTAPQAWIPPAVTASAIDIPGLSDAEWFIFNKQQTGYYRVNYDTDNWQRLAEVLASSHQTINVLNRAQLIDDSFNLARNGRLAYSYAFDMSTYLVNETDYIPWAAANAAFTTLNSVLSGTDTYSLFQDYLLHLSAPLYASLGFTVIAGEEFVTPYFRNIILNINCLHGNQDCVDTASQLLQDFRNDPTQRLNPDIQNTVFCSGLRGGDADNFNFLWSQYVNSQDSSEQSTLLSALGCTSNPELRDFFLNQVISDDSQVREQDRHSILVSVINAGPENLEAALDFVMEHFTEIQPRVQGLTGTTNILNAFARTLTSEQHGVKIDEFYTRYEQDFTAGELASVAAIRENIAAAVTWNEENLAMVDGWLRDNFGSNANGYRASIGLVLSFALYNVMF